MAERKVSVTISAKDDFSNTLRNYKTAMTGAKDANDKLGSSGKTTGGAFDGLAGSVKTAIAAYAGMQGVRLVADLTKQGNAVKLASAQFDALAGSTQKSQEMLSALQGVTKNTVSDFDLMLGANQLMTMGLATNTDEVSRLIEMALALRKPTQDAGAAIDDFAKLLANQSVLRLDNFGISSGRVRTRIDELLKSGQALNREEAFKLAVLEIGTASMERFGDATGIVDSSLMRMTTRFENAKNSIAEFTAQGIEAGAQLAELGVVATQVTIGEFQANQQEDAQLAVVAEEKGKIYAQQFVNGWQGELRLSQDDISGVLEEALRNPTQSIDQTLVNVGINPRTVNPEIYDELGSAIMFALNQEQAFTRAIEQRDAAQRRAAEAASVYDERMIAAGERQVTLNERAIAMERTAIEIAASDRRLTTMQSVIVAQNQLNAQLEREEAFRQRMAIQESDSRLAQQGVLAFQNQLNALTKDSANALAEAQQLGGGGGRFFDPSNVDDMQRLADEAQAAYEAAQQLGVSGPQLDGFRIAADETARMASEATRAADAFERASLSEILGQTSGGRQGQISDLFSSKLGDMGYTEEQIASFQQESDLLSGRETESSVAMQEAVQTAIDTVGINELPIAIQNLNANLDRLALQGVDTSRLDENAFMSMMGINRDGSVMPMTQPGMPPPIAVGQMVAPTQPVAALTGANMVEAPAAQAVGAQVSGGEEGAAGLDATKESIDEIKETLAEIEPLDLTPETLGLTDSSLVVDDIQSKLDDIDGTTYHAEVIISVKQVGGSVPPGANFTGSVSTSSNDTVSNPGGIGH